MNKTALAIVGLIALCGGANQSPNTNVVLDASNADVTIAQLRHLLDNEAPAVWRGAFSEAMSQLEKVTDDAIRTEIEKRIFGLTLAPPSTNRLRSADFVKDRLSWFDDAIYRYLGGNARMVERWRLRGGKILALKRENEKCKDIKDYRVVMKDPEIRKKIRAETDAYLERIGFNPKPRVYSVGVSPSSLPTYKRIMDEWAYVRTIRQSIAESEEYFDVWGAGLHFDYRRATAEQKKELIGHAKSALGRFPKWYPLVEDLTPEDAVERMGHDIECEFELARHEFGAFTKKLGAIPDMTRRAELIAKAAEMVLVREPGRERLPNYNEIEVKVNWTSALAGLLQNDKRASTAWSFRLRLLMAMKRVLERYEAANVSVWTAEGAMSIPTMRVHDIAKLQSLHNGYKKSMNDAEWQGLDALKIQLRILSYENQYFDGDDCVLKMCLARMTPEDRAETMKNVETVLGRKPKWYVDEARNAK